MSARCGSCGRLTPASDTFTFPNASGGLSVVCGPCLESAIAAGSKRDVEEEYEALLRGDAAPEEVETARRQIRRVK